MMELQPLFGGLPVGPELLIIVLVLVLLFGANKIPTLARSTGQAMGEFKRGRQDVEAELESIAASEEETDLDADSAGESGGETTADPVADPVSSAETAN